MKTPEKLLHQIKQHGPSTLKDLAKTIEITTMGVRQHLLTLESEGLLKFEDKQTGRGRPTRYWSLTEQSNSHFEDRHELLTVQLIDSVTSLFGEEGLEKLISHREQQTLAHYQNVLDKAQGIKQKLALLAKLRSDEGYMASIVEDNGQYWLLENHCPICSAAKHCLSFCRSEQALFQQLFLGLAKIQREEHILDGAHRCAYKVTVA